MSEQQDRAHTPDRAHAASTAQTADAAPAEPGDAAPAGQPDPRVTARASVAAGSSPSLWWVCAGLVVVLVVTVAAGPTPGGLALAGLLAGFAIARAVLRPGPVTLTVRSRASDTAVLAGLALAVGLLSAVIPTP